MENFKAMAEEQHKLVMAMEKNPPETHPDLEDEDWLEKGRESFAYPVPAEAVTPLDESMERNKNRYRSVEAPLAAPQLNKK